MLTSLCMHQTHNFGLYHFSNSRGKYVWKKRKKINRYHFLHHPTSSMLFLIKFVNDENVTEQGTENQQNQSFISAMNK